MHKLIIKNNVSFLSDIEALSYVQYVVEQGRISNYGKEYCFVTSWKNGVVVFTHRTKEGTDVFTVEYRPETT